MLVGNTFYGLNDPGPGFPMYYWNQTDTGLIYIRNSLDTSWVLVGDSNIETLNLLSRQGGSMNGPITGAHGLVPTTGGDTTGQTYLGGDPYVLKSYVDAQISQVKAQASSLIAQSFSAIPALDTSNKIAKAKGQFKVTGGQLGFVIDLPSYGDNTVALESECVWLAGVSSFVFGYYPDKFAMFKIKEVSPRHYTIEAARVNAVDLDTGGIVPATEAFTMYVNWMIIAFRSS